MRFNDIDFDAVRRVASAAANDKDFIVRHAGERLGTVLNVCDIAAEMDHNDDLDAVKVEVVLSIAQEWAHLLAVTGQLVRALPKSPAPGVPG